MKRVLLIIALAAAAPFAAHALPSSAAGPTTLARSANPGFAAGRYAGLAFVSDMDDNTVWICPTGNIRAGFLPATGQLQGVTGPVQMAIDRSGTVYVANAQVDESGQGAVTVYPRGQTSPSRTLTSGLNTSTGVAVDSAGTVYVSNKYTASVQVFPKGHSVPSATITKNLTGPDGLAVDAADDLFVADGSGNDVVELRHGSQTPRPLLLKGLSKPVGVAVDSQGNLFVSNLDGGLSSIAVYAPGSRTPARTFVIPYSANMPGTIGEPVMLSMGPGDMLLTSAFITLVPVGQELFGGPPVIAGFAAGQSQPEWSAYGIFAWDTVFQAAR